MPLLLLFPKKILTPCFRKAVALRTENTVSTANSKRARTDRKILSSLKMSMESLNFLAAWTAQIGLRVTDNGKTETTSRRQAILFSLIGKATEKPTM